MRWTPHYSRKAVEALFQVVAREHVKAVRDAILDLLEDPISPQMQATAEAPSLYWIAVPGDYVVYFEIIDERHIVRIIDIE